MESVARAAAVYFFVWLVFRLAGKRTLSDVSTFDFVLLLIISETTQAGLINNDHSLTNSFILIITFIGLDIGLSLCKRFWPAADQVLDSVPLIILADGKPIKARMKAERVDEADILSAARELHGLARLEQIKYAVLERNGMISVIPR